MVAFLVYIMVKYDIGMDDVGHRIKKGKGHHEQGFTLIELTIVMVIGAIIFLGAITLYKGYIEKAVRQTCNANCDSFEGMYQCHLLMENKVHTPNEFDEFLQNYGRDICPTDGEIKYVNGKVRCNLHFESEIDETEDGGDSGAVPYL